MPNIIEQQDLLKGLPDTRLAMLLQNPMGDIPPFLVAAEAQRRQSIRQQFAGSENKESVVDSLTKQLANVPQYIPAPTRTPPMVPPTPQMQGVAALQAQQAVQQMAQPQQMMRGGGMVQRYQVGGKVQPWWQIPDLSDTFSNVTGYLGEKIGDLAEFATRPYSEMQARDEASPVIPSLDTMTPEELADFNASVALPDVGVGGVRPVPPKPRARPADLTAPAPGETEDEFRARLEALYAAQEPSDWEKAQRYFAMAEQFLDPSKTTMQSVAGAGQAFAQSAAQTARDQREAELAREKAMLEYDMTLAQQRSAALDAEKQRTSLSADQQANILVKSQESVRRVIDSKREQLAKLTSDPMASRMDPTISTRIAALEAEIVRDEQRLMSIEGALAALGEQAYGPINFDTYSLNSGFSR